MTSVLTINGTSYTASQRASKASGPILLDRWEWSYDGIDTLEFHETGVVLPGSWTTGKSVSWSQSGTTYFNGVITEKHFNHGRDKWSIGYTCLGYKYLANLIPVTAVDGTGVQAYNLPPDDPDYLASYAGKTVGQILTDVFTQHSSLLSAQGISTDATTTAQLANLTVTPPEPVYFQGDRLWNAVEQLLAQWQRNHKAYIHPSNGKIRFYDLTNATNSATITLGTDPVVPPTLTKDTTNCYPRVVVRGKGKIASVYLSLGASTLTEAFSAGDKTAWKWSDFAQPGDAYDSGTVNSVLSSTSVRITSSNALTMWSTNFWSTRQARIQLFNSLGTSLTWHEERPVTANTSLSAGGTSDITLGFALENSGGSAYTSYKLIGTYGPLTGSFTSRNNTYRLYNVVTPGNYIEAHLVKKFPVPEPWYNYTGNSVQMTSYPEAMIIKSGTGYTVPFQVLPSTGQILFSEPTVKAINQQSTLDTGGGGVAVPDDIYAMLAYSRGALTSTYPADVLGSPFYSGTSYSIEGISRTLTVDVDAWSYAGNQTLMDTYAQMLHASVKDSVIEGDITYLGKWDFVNSPDCKIQIAATGYTTGWESTDLPVIGQTLVWNNDGDGTNFTTSARVSTKRNPRTGDRLYTHSLQQLGSPQSSFLDAIGGLSLPANWFSGPTMAAASDASGINGGDPLEGMDAEDGFEVGLDQGMALDAGRARVRKKRLKARRQGKAYDPLVGRWRLTGGDIMSQMMEQDADEAAADTGEDTSFEAYAKRMDEGPPTPKRRPRASWRKPKRTKRKVHRPGFDPLLDQAQEAEPEDNTQTMTDGTTVKMTNEGLMFIFPDEPKSDKTGGG